MGDHMIYSFLFFCVFLVFLVSTMAKAAAQATF